MDRHRQRLTTLLAIATFVAPATAQVLPGYGGFGQPCPLTTGGWSLQWRPPLTSASWDSSTGLLYVSFGTVVQAFSYVPIGAIQALSASKNPLPIYTNTIVPRFHQILLSEKDHCPLRWEYQGTAGAYIWTD